MNRDRSHGTWSAPSGTVNATGKSKLIGREPESISASKQSFNSVQIGRDSLLALSLSAGGLARDDPRVVTALEEYLEALHAGHPWSRDDFLAQHSEIADALNQCLSGLEFIHTAGAQLDGSQSFFGVHPPGSVPPSIQLGDYRILREIGRGGMGVVYEAEQVSLGRHVALKVLPFAAAIDPKQRQRFQIEAQAAAQLHHPHIVPIFSVGCDHGIHYYAMQFVEGRSLAVILHELRHVNADPLAGSEKRSPAIGLESTEKANPSANNTHVVASPPSVTLEPSVAITERDASGDPETISAPGSAISQNDPFLVPKIEGSMHRDRAYCRNIARLGAEAADALDHAHGLGILHRDIKPANLLIDPHGALWITDFGLARFPSDLSLTHTGDMVGTLRYMSPEQALARRGVVDQRTDIYSLGATLYELLTLRPAFDGRDHQELLRQIALDEPTRPRRLNSAVPRDLETIVLKAMAKDPSSRYATAQDLAADLKRFLDDRPILARRPGPAERGLRWALRHRELVATTVAILVLAMIVSTAAIWAQARKTKVANNNLKDANHKHNVYIIETWPLLDEFAMQRMGQATDMLNAQADPATREEIMGTYRQALNFYTHATALPPADLESRAIIARAHNRLGFTIAMLSAGKGSKDKPDPAILSQAEVGYRRSIVLFEDLYKEFPTDPKVRRFFAEALGSWGWALTKKGVDGEAVPHFERAVQLLREQIRDAGADTHATEGVNNVLNDLGSMASIVLSLSGIFESTGQVQKVSDLRRQLDDDINVLAARFSEPDDRRKFWAEQFMQAGGSSLNQNNRLGAALDFRLVTILAPDNAVAHNNLAWAMTSVPESTIPFEISRALDSARKATELVPKRWIYWNTLGVAAFRARDWKLAKEALETSIKLNNGGGAIDFFFLAMTRWHEGKPDEAKKFFDKGATYVQHNPNDMELYEFYREADALLKKPPPKSEPKAHQKDKNVNHFTEDVGKVVCFAAGTAQSSVKKPAVTIPPGDRDDAGTFLSTTAKSGSLGTWRALFR